MCIKTADLTIKHMFFSRVNKINLGLKFKPQRVVVRKYYMDYIQKMLTPHRLLILPLSF